MDNILGTFFAKLVAILGVVAVMGIAYKVYQSNSANNLINQISQTSMGVQSLYSAVPFTTLTNTVAINGKIVPDDMVSGAALINPYNGTATLAVNGANAAQFDLTETNVPSYACSQLVQGLKYAAVKINGTAIALPADPSAVTTACAAATNTIVTTFGH